MTIQKCCTNYIFPKSFFFLSQAQLSTGFLVTLKHIAREFVVHQLFFHIPVLSVAASVRWNWDHYHPWLKNSSRVPLLKSETWTLWLAWDFSAAVDLVAIVNESHYITIKKINNSYRNFGKYKIIKRIKLFIAPTQSNYCSHVTFLTF